MSYLVLGAGISPVFLTLDIILGAILIYMICNWLYLKIQRGRVGTELSNEAFNEGMRKAQILDLREKKDFDAGHILGARNLPYTAFKDRVGEVRKDLPVYLYDSGRTLSTRAAIKLNKMGYEHIFWLKSGYEGWKGKTKRK